VPRPRSLASSPAFASAASNFTDTIERALRGDIKAGFETSNISFSLAIVSHSQPDPSVPLWEYHHLSPNNANGTRHLDRDSQYLIGSISKVISDAILLKSGVDLDDAVTKFLPVLGERDTPIDWKSISLRDLGDHLAGIPPNCEQ
jgi:CubicO group peptidase (beta-lactamase class C family)